MRDKLADEEPPLRSELFSADQMEQHGKNLALSHRLATGRSRDRLLVRLAENAAVLDEVGELLVETVAANERITPAAEWLLDNFYLIEEQIRTTKRHLPKGYSLELPKLARGPSATLPRVYDLAFEAISHGDGRIDEESLSRFVAAYQTVAPLTMGELWAFPIMLRLALIENLRRVGTRIATAMRERERAGAWADQMLEVAEHDPKNLILVIADMARSNPPMVSAFVAELVRRLQGQSAALALPLTWIEQRLGESGFSIEQLVQVQAQTQAAVQVSTSNSIGSLRLLGAIEWRKFFESTSVVEQKLREDPGGLYGRMDFATRDRYRHAVEEMARGSSLGEGDVARKAIQLAFEAAKGAGGTGDGDADRTAHVGYYLVDRGRQKLEQAAGVRITAAEGLRRATRRVALLPYLGGMFAITAGLTAALLVFAYDYGVRVSTLPALGVLLLIALSQLASGVVNWLVTLVVKPRALPRMDYSSAIPSQSRTLVVVPTMLTCLEGIDHLVEALEVRFLANRDSHLHFGLLTDFLDAATETCIEDDLLLWRARKGIEDLNAKYGHVDPATGQVAADRFYLFHRPRRWNAKEGVWMGEERKRGKLAALNAVLRGNGEGGFSLVVGDTEKLTGVRYVITLDTDTQLPRDAAREMVATMAHPLNRARFEQGGLVTEGYGILQPRVAISLPGANRSLYARLHGGDTGIDPYTRAVSDVYQDAFAEGSFIGKGIYDVDAFECALAGRFPENRILSHDLIEGCHVRSGLLSDVQLYEDYPATYGADISRRHRWVRGDWQLFGWLRAQVRGAGPRHFPNPLSWLSQWKVFDNLRRSLVPAALTALLILGWTVLGHAWLWTLVVIGILVLPSAIALFADLLRKPRDMPLRQHLEATIASAGRHGATALLTLAFLPYEASVNVDAIVRATMRMMFSLRGLLEWTPSAVVRDRHGLLTAIRTQWAGPALAIVLGVVLERLAPYSLAVAAPVLLLWFISPLLAWWISRPVVRRKPQLDGEQLVFLRNLARRTWAFFDTFVGPEDNWLPPDSYQEHPGPVVAHRTSPTNIGFSLLANLSAYDFGYIPAGQLLARTAGALETMVAMERFEGHFYNWYDTRSLKPLRPLYVSAVDSGNLGGHLMTLKPGLLALADDRVIDRRWFEGLGDTARTLAEAERGAATVPLGRLQRALESAYDAPPTTLVAARERLDALAAHVDEVAALVTGEGDARAWADALVRQIAGLREELATIAPWSDTEGGAERWPGRDIPTLREIAAFEARALPVEERHATQRMALIERLAAQCDELARMEYAFLYDKSRHLLAIGYNVGERRLDASFYDLLASEARFSSFVAIAQGQLPQENWFALGRQLTAAGGRGVLLSWSGSMFEYLMPVLVMPAYENTLLEQTGQEMVKRQVAYGKQRGVPWGISESGYNAVDSALNYQYRAFGVPGLGFKRGLADDLVVAPYASALALTVDPEESCSNLQRLAGDGMAGRYGLFEAIDYTPARVPRGQSSVIVRSFMAHHQGMILLSLTHVLLGAPMQKRFTSDPLVKATLLLLQERIPKVMPIDSHPADLAEVRAVTAGTDAPVRVFATPNTPIPEVQLLSNGRYHVMVTNAGGGSTRWRDLAVTRWREDGTADPWGTFCYIRDVATGDFWSASHQPTLKQPEHYEAIFTESRAEFRRRDNDFETHTEIAVSPEDDIDLRRLHITNRARVRRTIEVTSYAEVALAPSAADALHPAFSNLFVQTESVARGQAILSTRRPRARDESVPWMLHLMSVHGAASQDVSWETDRMAFIGRGRSLADPIAMAEAGRLSGGQGSVLDPIVSIRHRIVLDPQQTVTIDLTSGVAETREGALGLIAKYQDQRLADRVFDLAWTHSGVTLRQINATESDAQLYSRLAGSVIHANATLRAEPGIIARNRRAQSGLWSHAISGDLPIVVLQIGDSDNIDLVRRMVQAHAYWRLKGLAVDLVIWNDDRGGYRQVLQDQIMGLVAAGVEAHVIDRPGGIFVRRAEQIADEDRILLNAVARVIITDRRGSLAEQVMRRGPAESRLPRFAPSRPYKPETETIEPPSRDLILSNGLGGFAADGSEYVITMRAGDATPVPWVNVVANPDFGTVISESGGAYTWSENAHEYRLSPWHNDPVRDESGEALYLRDEETGHFWSPTPLPARGAGTYVTRHGFGYSVFEHREDGIETELWVYVALDAPVKFSVLRMRNVSGRARRVSATGYVEWVLGDLRPKTAMHVVTEVDMKSGALFARNAYITEFPGRVAFLDVDDSTRSVTADRTEFLGRNGEMRDPAAMSRARLSGKVGPALDPCGAMQVVVDLAEDEEREIVFRLGVGRHAEEAAALVQRYRGPIAARAAFDAVRAQWSRTLGAVQIETPDPAINVMANGWLLYQTVASRLWARSGYYQSGGAFGFRDQLQDTMALVHAEPALVREHLVRSAGRQFLEGDVQHWWHPPSGRGVRTRCSDDYLWLPLAAARYVKATGDASVLDEEAAFLEGRPVNAGDDSYYDLPNRSSQSATVYEHCLRAVEHGLRFGAHGLPLMGSGDWNDGMNLVGIKGTGESVWLGFFLCAVLEQFAEVARLRGDATFADKCETQRVELRRNLDRHAWDGEWYRRAYFDDGTPLGTASGTECRIDSVSQSWSVLSGAGEATRARTAMLALDERLVRRDHSLVQLLDPPFDNKSGLDPGYIRGYVPGVRENGGQYTHGAIWAAMAFAALGDRERAWELTSMINPPNRSSSPEASATYKVEPYVICADVYGVAPHTGRGGWSWYTGSAGWMYRLVIESLLGISREGDRLRFTPCLPPAWNAATIRYRFGASVYEIVVEQGAAGSGATRVTLDGAAQPDNSIALVDDNSSHRVAVAAG
nr:glycoside hydrolase family 94 protein [Usitatibacter palustris]